MKKLLGIVVLSLLLSVNVFANHFSYKVPEVKVKEFDRWMGKLKRKDGKWFFKSPKKFKKLDIDKDVLAETSNLQLLSTLAMLAPFNKIDKQAILESPNISTRINTINSILDLNTFQVVSNKNPNQLN